MKRGRDVFLREDGKAIVQRCPVIESAPFYPPWRGRREVCARGKLLRLDPPAILSDSVEPPRSRPERTLPLERNFERVRAVWSSRWPPEPPYPACIGRCTGPLGLRAICCQSVAIIFINGMAKSLPAFQEPAWATCFVRSFLRGSVAFAPTIFTRCRRPGFRPLP